MDFSEHLVITGAGSAAILAGGGGWEEATAFGVMGVFIDLDHFIDYWRETGFNLDIPRFMSYFSKKMPKHMWLLLHAWEYPALALFALRISADSPAWCYWGLAGWFLHLCLDHRYNGLHKFAYYMSFRIRHKFDADVFNLD